LRRMYPHGHITWVVEGAAADLVRTHPYLDRVLVSHRKEWAGKLRRGRDIRRTLSEIRSFVRRLRDRRYDLVIDFHGLLKSSLITLASGGARRLGYDSMQELSGLFVNEKIFENMEKHAVDRYLDFLRYLGAKIDTPEFLIAVEEDNKARVHTLLRSHGIDPDKSFVAVNPVAFWDTKLWYDEKFARLGDRITEELDVTVILTGGSATGALGHIQSEMRHASINLGGQTTLRELAYLYSLSSLLVTTDSGPMHIAAAVGTPVVALFGPTDPVRTGPYGAGHVVLRKEFDCSPCFLKKCDSMKCMREITVEEVFDAVTTLLRRETEKNES
jgi:heptosyltransferase-1